MILANQEEEKKLSWLPVFLWISIPVCFWSYSNNMHENTMSIFTFSSILLYYKSVKSGKGKVAYLLASGLMVFLASLSKGLPGFFPLGAPFLYYLFVSRNKFLRVIYECCILTGIPILIYAILIQFPHIKLSLSTYLFERALHRISEDPTVSSRFYILLRLLTELTPAILIIIIFSIIARHKRLPKPDGRRIRIALFLISLGISGSLPLMFTMVQKGFYFVPSLPFFAVGFSILISPSVTGLIKRASIQQYRTGIFQIACICIFLFSIAFTILQIGKTNRNKELLHDVYNIGKALPSNSAVSVMTNVWNEWDLQCYLIRYFTISLDPDSAHRYWLFDKTLHNDIPVNLKKLEINTNRFELYEDTAQKK